MTAAAPYSEKELDDELTALGVARDETVAVAVSGGADSLCLALLAARVRPAIALTVDHGLRPEAAEEAAFVADVMQRHSVRHETLAWRGEKPSSNVQALAREARYRLLGDQCQKEGIRFLLTAHHLDDVAETFLLRLARGSGAHGLAAMKPVTALAAPHDSILLVRPLLQVPKSRLVAALEGRRQPWVEDPSNEDAHFDRVRARSLLRNPPLEGLSPERLAATAQRLGRVRDALEHYEQEWLQVVASESPHGNIFLRTPDLETAPREIMLRGLAAVLKHVSGSVYGPRLEKLVRALDTLLAVPVPGFTFHGCQIVAAEGGAWVCRELAAMQPRTKLGAGALYDNRFRIDASSEQSGLEIGPLGEAGWQQAIEIWPDIRSIGLPEAARLSLPAIYSGKQLRGIPHLGYALANSGGVKLSQNCLYRPKK